MASFLVASTGTPQSFLNVLGQRVQKSGCTSVALGHTLCYGIIIILRELGLEKHFCFQGASIMGY